MSSPTKIIDINWEGPLHITYDRESDSYRLPQDALLEGSGFYQIYGRHPVYGPSVLLYIGETKESESGGRSLHQRLYEHLRINGRFWYHVNLSLIIGVPCELLSPEDIKIVESVLIAAHKPALNRQHLDKAKKDSIGYFVRNWNFIGSLNPECSGEYWHQSV